MAQKVNPTIFRIQKKCNLWPSRYMEKKCAEKAEYLMKDLELKYFIHSFFKSNQLISTRNVKINYLNNSIFIYVSYFFNNKALRLVKLINKKRKIKFRLRKLKSNLFLKKYLLLWVMRHKQYRYKKISYKKKSVKRKVRRKRYYCGFKPRNYLCKNTKFKIKIKKKKKKFKKIKKRLNFTSLFRFYNNFKLIKRRISRSFFEKFFFVIKQIFNRHSIYLVLKQINRNIKLKKKNFLKKIKIKKKKKMLKKIKRFKIKIRGIKKKIQNFSKRSYQTNSGGYGRNDKFEKFRHFKKKDFEIKSAKTSLGKQFQQKNDKYVQQNLSKTKNYNHRNSGKNKPQQPYSMNNRHNNRSNFQIRGNQKFVKHNFKKPVKKKKKSANNKIISQLRKFRKSLFFKEGLNIVTRSVRNTNYIPMLTSFLAYYFQKLRRNHSFFIQFIKNIVSASIKKSFSKIQSIKIKIKGRINGRPRARPQLLIIGKAIPNATIDSKIHYFEDVSFTADGTLGIKVWSYLKKHKSVKKKKI